MEILDWQKNWNELGKDDPLWVVLTDPTKKGGKWEPAEFFETGRAEIDAALREIAVRKFSLRQGRALDFGCGVGRLSQALARRFERVDGVDISPSMIEHAKRFNQFPQKCHYHVNPAADLRLFEDNTFDFLYSAITLQHIEPRFQKSYLQEFVRVLAPDGIAYFQILSATLRRRLFPTIFVNLIRRRRAAGRAFIGMFGVPQRQVDSIVRQSGGTILDKTSQSASWRWSSHRYIVRK
jgi:cyclopropane fatty-acyl-phospholipid synthase-like methyltransferase